MQKPQAAVEVVETALDATKWAQILTLVKDNQLLTAFGLFFLWQTGALLSAATYVQGGVC